MLAGFVETDRLVVAGRDCGGDQRSRVGELLVQLGPLRERLREPIGLCHAPELTLGSIGEEVFGLSALYPLCHGDGVAQRHLSSTTLQAGIYRLREDGDDDAIDLGNFPKSVALGVR